MPDEGPKHADRVRRLLDHDLGTATLDLLADYVCCVFDDPWESMGEGWGITVFPGTSTGTMLRFNVAWVQTLVVRTSGEVLLYVAAESEPPALPDDVHVSEGTKRGGKNLCLEIADIGEAREILGRADVRARARAHVESMTGASLAQPNYHNPAAGKLLMELMGAEPLVSGSPDGTE